MKGYSKIKLVNSCSSRKSRSIDFSDETLTPTPTKIHKQPTSNIKPTICHFQYDQHDDDDDDDYKHYSHSDNIINHQKKLAAAVDQDDHTNLPINLKLTKNQLLPAVAPNNGSTTTTDSGQRFKIEKQNSTGRALMQQSSAVIIRAMSIRRSSSVTSERYSRIHDQYANTFDVHDEIKQQEEDFKYAKSKHNIKKHKGSVLKAYCKRIFGL